jgi:hypothetical protein
MRLRNTLCLDAMLVLFGALAMAQAEVPQMINYQVIILDSDGDPVTTTSNVIFAIWNAAADGDSLWSEQRSVTPDNQGRFNVLLGGTMPVPDSAFDGSDRWLSIKVGADQEMSPRSRLSSVAYAYRSALAETAVIGGGWTDEGTVVRLATSTDSVGIGTSSPHQKLGIAGHISLEGFTPGHSTAVDFRDPDGSQWHLQYYQGGLNFWEAGIGSRMLIEDGGNVGIGTINPQGALDVHSTTGALIVPRMSTTSRDALTAVNGMIIYNTTTDTFNFYENGAWVTK